MAAARTSPRDGADERPWLIGLAVFIAALAVLRLIALAVTPLELYPDEAQYWLWSRRPAFGYYSKPPMIAWLIALSTRIGGDGEFWVRLPAALIAAATPLALYKAGERLAGRREGVVAALIFALMPGMQLAAGVIATDAPMLLCLALALWAYSVLWSASSAGKHPGVAAALGLALGCAFLSKYAAAYFVIGLVLHACVSRRARALWDAKTSAAAVGTALLVLAPHLVWSAGHGFSAVAHAAGNAAAQKRVGLLDSRGGLGFVLGQSVVFGPIPLLALAGGAAWRARRRTLTETDILLLCLTAPPLAIVMVEAFIARANANWAAAAFVPAAVLVAIWLIEWRAWRTLWAALLPQGALALLFLAAAAQPVIADRLGLGASLKYARGRAAQAQIVAKAMVEARRTGPVTAVVSDYRFDFNSLAYYGRDLFGTPGSAPGAPPLRMWAKHERPLSQADVDYRLTPATGGRVLFINAVPAFGREARADFAGVEERGGYAIPLGGRKRVRAGKLFVGVDFRPRPRDHAAEAPDPN